MATNDEIKKTQEADHCRFCTMKQEGCYLESQVDIMLNSARSDTLEKVETFLLNFQNECFEEIRGKVPSRGYKKGYDERDLVMATRLTQELLRKFNHLKE